MGDKINKNKLDNGTALAKIKVLINIYFERIGRDEVEDIYNEERVLIYGIDEILDDADIDTKKVIIERLELDRLNKP